MKEILLKLNLEKCSYLVPMEIHLVNRQSKLFFFCLFLFFFSICIKQYLI